MPDCAKLAGAIAGRALYDGRLDPPKACADRSIRAGREPLRCLSRRVIPCLDVKDGRVVKGVNFVDLRDAGDPVACAIAYDAAGADELCFLDITASHEDRGILLDVVQRTAEACFMPLTVGGGVRTIEDIRKLLLAGADKVSIMTAAVHQPRVRPRGGRKIRQPVHRRRHRRQSRPAPGRWEIFTHGGRKPTGLDALGLCAGSRGARRRRNSADLDGPRRHQIRLRYRADPRGRRCRRRAGDRLGRRRRRSIISSKAFATAARAPCSPPRSSTSANSPSPRPSDYMARAGIAMRLDGCSVAVAARCGKSRMNKFSLARSCRHHRRSARMRAPKRPIRSRFSIAGRPRGQENGRGGGRDGRSPPSKASAHALVSESADLALSFARRAAGAGHRLGEVLAELERRTGQLRP